MTDVVTTSRPLYGRVRSRLEDHRRRLRGMQDLEESYPRLEIDLAAVEDVLERLDTGTYGHCELCGSRIGDVRLSMFPATRWCALHQHGPEIRID